MTVILSEATLTPSEQLIVYMIESPATGSTTLLVPLVLSPPVKPAVEFGTEQRAEEEQ